MKKHIMVRLEVDVSDDQTSCYGCDFAYQISGFSYCKIYDERLEDDRGLTLPLRSKKCVRDQIVAGENWNERRGS